MKKVLFCTATLKTGRGGVASYAQDFIHAFSSTYLFSVITSDEYQKDASDTFELRRLDTFDFSLRNAEKLLHIINEEKPEIVVNSHFPLLALITPYISDDIKVISISHFTDGRLAWAAGMNGNYADSIITLSVYAKKYIEHKFHIEDEYKVKIIYNYMESLPDRPIDKTKRRPLSIVYPGGDSHHKSPDVVCTALKRLLKTDLDFEFHWIGRMKVPGGHLPFVSTRTINDAFGGGDKRIHTMAAVPRNEAKRLMAECNIFLLPSRGEGCPITLLEAMRGGCIPIISDAKHGSLDLIEDGVTGFVTRQGHANDIVEIITMILLNPDRYSYIYKNTLLKFGKDLEKSVWIKKMTSLLEGDFYHQHRERSFNKAHFMKDALYLKYLYTGTLIKNYLVYNLYEAAYFRYARYFMKVKNDKFSI